MRPPSPRRGDVCALFGMLVSASEAANFRVLTQTPTTINLGIPQYTCYVAMSERASISKDPVLPPSAPRRLASRSPSTSRVRLRDPGRASIDRESSSALGLGRHVPPSFAYPTPGTGRKNGTRRSSFVFKKNVQALDLEPASAPRHDLRGICNADVKDLDSPTEGSITTSRPVFSKVVGTNSAKHTESLQRNDGSKDKGGGKGGLEADSSSDDKEGGDKVLGSPRRQKELSIDSKSGGVRGDCNK
ncbi:hypothetical protein RhiTH_010219 [Rhizoctonia solani]